MLLEKQAGKPTMTRFTQKTDLGQYCYWYVSAFMDKTVFMFSAQWCRLAYKMLVLAYFKHFKTILL